MFSKYLYLANLSYLTFGASANHSYSRYGLLVTDIKLGTPQRVTTVIKTPRGSRDITDAISSNPAYDLRTISVSFVMSEGSYNDIYKLAEDELNGKYFEDIYISKYDRYFAGRIFVDIFTSDVKKGILSIKITAEPYSYKQKSQESYAFRLTKGTPVTQETEWEIGTSIYAKSNGTYTTVRTSSVEGGEISVTLPQDKYTKIGVINSANPSFDVEYTGSGTTTYSRTVSVIARKEEIA